MKINGVEYSDELLDPGEIDISGVRGEFAYTKPQQHLRKHPSVRSLNDANTGRLTDLSAKHSVVIGWNLNEAANRDKVFMLRIDEKEVYLDLDELLYYTRMIG